MDASENPFLRVRARIARRWVNACNPDYPVPTLRESARKFRSASRLRQTRQQGKRRTQFNQVANAPVSPNCGMTDLFQHAINRPAE
jgi:hypothetical protein